MDKVESSPGSSRVVAASTRCKEGFQGIRCDQFLPKTDSILSDPNASHMCYIYLFLNSSKCVVHVSSCFLLLVCFVPTESKEVYKRQVMSITCIAMGISFLGTLCMALYCRNK
ncbi:hypothetical protein cypCar_00017763 [Cyprinus carpio]|nr:hypothetical protein cypCar_00017763 [Cyprinus carpio]